MWLYIGLHYFCHPFFSEILRKFCKICLNYLSDVCLKQQPVLPESMFSLPPKQTKLHVITTTLSPVAWSALEANVFTVPFKASIWKNTISLISFTWEYHWKDQICPNQNNVFTSREEGGFRATRKPPLDTLVKLEYMYARRAFASPHLYVAFKRNKY